MNKYFYLIAAALFMVLGLVTRDATRTAVYSIGFVVCIATNEILRELRKL